MSTTTSTSNKVINSKTCRYCYIDFDINEHRSTLGLVAGFVYNTNSRYGFTSNDLRCLGGSELARIVDDKLLTTDHEWSSKWNNKQQQQQQQQQLSSELIRPPTYGTRIVFELYWDDCPIACENFATLCANGTDIGIWLSSQLSVDAATTTTNSNSTTTKSNITTISFNKTIPIGECGRQLSYRNSIIHRIVPNFIIQGGDYVFGNGSGGESIYGSKKFKDEKVGLQKKHTKRGLLSMGNSGKNSNSSQFFITFSSTHQCDGKHVIFGHIVSGWDVLSALENVGTSSTSNNDGTPTQLVTITDCGIYTPFYTPGQGYWYDQPDPESYTGISSIFIVRPRIAIVAPNHVIIDKFHSSMKQQKFSSSTFTLIDINATIYENDWDVINKHILELITSYSIDVVIVAPACYANISATTLAAATMAEAESTTTKINNNITLFKNLVQIAFPQLSSLEDVLKMFILESKPLDAIVNIYTKSWFVPTQTNSSMVHLSWQLDGKQ